MHINVLRCAATSFQVLFRKNGTALKHIDKCSACEFKNLYKFIRVKKRLCRSTISTKHDKLTNKVFDDLQEFFRLKEADVSPKKYIIPYSPRG